MEIPKGGYCFALWYPDLGHFGRSAHQLLAYILVAINSSPLKLKTCSIHKNSVFKNVINFIQSWFIHLGKQNVTYLMEVVIQKLLSRLS